MSNIITLTQGVDDMNNFQERLTELLEDNNMSRLKLAKEINSTSTTINGYFNKDYFPTLEIAIRISKYFNISLDYLFGLSDNKENTNNNCCPFFENFNSLVSSSKKSILNTMKEMNFTDANYYRWKSGLIPKTSNLVTIAKHFGVSLDYLVGNKKD